MESNFPELEGNVTGENYPPPPFVELLQKLLSVVQLGGILFAVLGSNVFSLFGIRRVPNWYYTVEKSSVQIAIVVYLLMPQMLSKYLITGAFEIILDGDKTIFSKLALGRLPQYADLMNPLVEAGLQPIKNQ